MANLISWIFTAKRRGSINANLENRIVGLLATSELEKESSPILKGLQNRNNRKVRRITSIYEENISAFNENNTSVLIRKPLQKNSLSPKFVRTKETDEPSPLKSSVVLQSPDKGTDERQFDVPCVISSNYKVLIDQLIDMDAKYIENMERMIKHYVAAFDNLPPVRLKNEAAVTNRLKLEMFGPIERIHKLHKFTFTPRLLACGHDIQLFASNISKLSKEGDFNCYIIFAMDEKDCEYRRNVYYKPFIQEIADKCGFPFKFSPIQQLSHYVLIVIKILNEVRISQTLEADITAMATAEKDLRQLMSNVNSMRSLQRIKM